MLTTRLSLVLAVLIMLPGVRDAVAQNTGVVSGTIIDASAQVVPGATITLTN